MTLGQKIRQFGEKNFNTVKDFADAMDMQAPSLQKYLNDEREPGSPVLRRLRKLGCDLNWLFDNNNERAHNPLNKSDLLIKGRK